MGNADARGTVQGVGWVYIYIQYICIRYLCEKPESSNDCPLNALR